MAKRFRFRPPGLKPTTKIGALGPYRWRLGLGWVIAPIVADSLDDTISEARLQGTAALLDASLDPQDKFDIAPSLFATGLAQNINPEFEAALTKDAAFPRRMGKADEYAKLAVAIVENPMLNGGTIRLDAGTRFSAK